MQSDEKSGPDRAEIGGDFLSIEYDTRGGVDNDWQNDTPGCVFTIQAKSTMEEDSEKAKRG